MERTFSADPPVSTEYELDGSQLYKTRNLVLEAYYGGSRLTSLTLVMALPVGRPGFDTMEAGGGIMKFRSIAPEQRFLVERSLVLSVGGEARDLGPCAYETGLVQERGVVENLTAFVPIGLLRQMADADTVRGTVGQVPFQLTGPDLSPVRALLDSVSIR